MMMGVVLAGPFSAFLAALCEAVLTGAVTWPAPVLVGMLAPVLFVAARLAAILALPQSAGAASRPRSLRSGD
jgi:hypothetical protein